jgi:hypothetical protein
LFSLLIYLLFFPFGLHSIRLVTKVSMFWKHKTISPVSYFTRSRVSSGSLTTG